MQKHKKPVKTKLPAVAELLQKLQIPSTQNTLRRHQQQQLLCPRFVLLLATASSLELYVAAANLSLQHQFTTTCLSATVKESGCPFYLQANLITTLRKAILADVFRGVGGGGYTDTIRPSIAGRSTRDDAFAVAACFWV